MVLQWNKNFIGAYNRRSKQNEGDYRNIYN
jgi:hypothetical protein